MLQKLNRQRQAQTMRVLENGQPRVTKKILGIILNRFKHKIPVKYQMFVQPVETALLKSIPPDHELIGFLENLKIDFDNQGPIYQMILNEVDATIEEYKKTL